MLNKFSNVDITKSKQCKIFCIVLALHCFTYHLNWAQVFNPASDYNLFVRNNAGLNYSDVEGAVAIGGNATIQDGYSIGMVLTPNATRNDLVVGGTLSSQWNMVMERGSIRHVGAYTQGQNAITFGVSGATRTQGASPIDFAATQTTLTTRSTYFNGLTANGTTSNSGGVLTLTGTSSTVNIFSLTSFPNSISTIRYNVPMGSTVIVNVGGSSPTINTTNANTANFQYWDGSAYQSLPDAYSDRSKRQYIQKVVWNFPAATSMTLQNVGFKGTVLAPNAALSAGSGHIDGHLFVNSMQQVGGGNSDFQVNWFPFDGTMPLGACGTIVTASSNTPVCTGTAINLTSTPSVTTYPVYEQFVNYGNFIQWWGGAWWTDYPTGTRDVKLLANEALSGRPSCSGFNSKDPVLWIDGGNYASTNAWQVDLNVVAGTTYSLSFDTKDLYGGANSAQPRWFVGGTAVGTASTLTTGGCAASWTTNSTTWTATSSGLVKFSIRNARTSTAGSANDFGIDNVSISTTTTPSNGFSWSGPNSFTSSAQNPSISSATTAMAGNYIITLTNGSCIGTATSNVVVNSCSACTNVTSAGAVGSNQTFCGSTYDPTAFTQTTAASGGSGTLEYQWQSSPDNSTWTNISGATLSTYDAPSISATQYYRRGVRRSGCTTYLYTSVVTITKSTVTANAGTDISQCYNSYFPLAANYKLSGQWGAWSIISGSGTFLDSDMSQSENTVMVNAGNTLVLRWTMQDGTCTATDDITLSNTTSCSTTCPSTALNMNGDLETEGNATNFNLTFQSTPTLLITSSTSPAGWEERYGSNVANTSTFQGAYYIKKTGATGNPHSGTHYSYLKGSGFCYSAFSSPLKVACGRTYKLSVWIAAYTVSGAQQNAPFALEFSSSSDTGTPAEYTTGIDLLAPASTSFNALNWQRYEVLFTVPDNGYTWNDLFFTSQSDATGIMIDDVCITEVTSGAASYAGVDQSSCNNVFTMSGNTPPSGYTGTWSVVSGVATIASANSPTSAVTITSGTVATLRWTVSNGTCSSYDDVVLGFITQPNISVNSPTICSGASTTLTATGCTGSLLWSTGATSSSISVSPTSTTSYTVTCTPTASANLLLNPSFESTTSLQYWSNWASTSITTVASEIQNGARAAKVNATSVAGGFGQDIACSPGEFFTVTFWAKSSNINPGTQVGIKFLNSSYTDISSEITAEVLSNTYQQYTLTGTAPLNAAYIEVFTWTSTSSISYFDNIVVTKSLSCAKTATGTVTVSPPITLTAGRNTNNPYCLGENVGLWASSPTSGTFSWSGPSGFTSSVQNPTLSNLTNAMAGTYTVTLTNSLGCSAVASTNVTIYCPSLSCTNNLLTNWSFETDDLTGWTTFSTTGQTNFVWVSRGYNADGTRSAVLRADTPEPPAGQPNVLYQEIPAVAGAVYNLTFYGGVHDPSKNFTAYISFWNSSNVNISNSSSVQIDHDVDGATPPLLQYSINNVIAPSGTSKLRVEFRAIGDAVKIDAVCLSMTCNNVTGAGTIGSNQTACGTSYDPALLTQITAPTGGTGTLQYQWQISSDNVIWTDIVSANAQTYDPTSITGTRYYRRGVRMVGCTSDLYSNVVTVTVNSIPTAPTGTPASRCGTGTVALGASGCSGGTINWYAAASGGSSLGTGTSFTTPSISSTTTYYVDCTLNGCTSSRTAVTATVNTIPTANITGTTTICNGSNTTLTASGGGTYLWNTTATSAAITVNPSSTTTYTVTVTSSGCTATASSTVTVNSIPTAPTGVSASRCGTGTVGLGASGCSGGTINWYASASGGSSLGTGTSFTTPSISSTTTYYVDCTLNGCVSSRTAVTATVNSIPTANITGTTTICNGSNTTLTASGGGTYLWSNAATTAAITVSPAVTTTYTVTVTSSGCTATASRTVTVNNLPVAAVSGTNVICNGSNTTLTASGGGTYLWSNAATTAAITVSPTATTTYTVTVTSSGCTATASRTVTVNNLPVAAISGTNVICNGSNTTLTASGGGTYLWSNAATTAAITVSPTATTTYTVTVTSSGCIATASRTVTVNNLPVAAISGTNILCNSSSTTLTASGGGTYLWSTSATTVSISVSPTATTTYTVTVTSSGCTATATRTVTRNPAPNYTGVITSPVTCSGTTANSNGSIVVNATNADKAAYSAGLTYSGAAYASATALASGSTTFGSLSNPVGGQYYTVRIFNGSDLCYKDTTVILESKICFRICIVPNIFQNNSFESGTFTSNASYVDANNAMSFANYNTTTNVTGWYVDAGYWINDAQRATDGSKFVEIGTDNACWSDKINVGTGANDICNGQNYEICFDFASFDATDPTNVTPDATEIAVEFVNFSSSSPQVKRIIGNGGIADLIDASNNTTIFTAGATVTTSTASWENLKLGVRPLSMPGWHRGCASFTTDFSAFFFTGPLEKMGIAFTKPSGKDLLIDNVSLGKCSGTCVPPPTVTTIAASAATCTGSTPNANASITVSATGGDKVGISSGTGYWGAAYSALTTSLSGGTYTFTGLPAATDVPGEFYTIRIFNGNNYAYKDTTVLVPYSNCASKCIMDQFHYATPQVLDVPWSATNPVSATGVLATSTVFGGERDLLLTRTSGTSTFRMEIATWDPGVIYMYSGQQSDLGSLTITYDGVDNNASTLNATGLGGVSMSNGSFTLDAEIDNTTPLGTINFTIRVYSSATNWSYKTLSISTATGYQTLTFAPATFTIGGGTGANFNNVGAVQLITSNTVAGTGWRLKNFFKPCACITPTPSISGTTSICRGSSTTLTASGGSTYLWSTSVTTVAITVSPTVTTTYTVTATNPGGCTAAASQSVTVTVPPTAGTASPLSICKTDVSATTDLFAQLTGEQAGGTWQSIAPFPSGMTSTIVNTKVTSGVLQRKGFPAGTYTFRYTVIGTSPCPNDTEDVIITINSCCPPAVCMPTSSSRL
jgi:choice-of-anchor A domain-containing protein